MLLLLLVGDQICTPSSSGTMASSLELWPLCWGRGGSLWDRDLCGGETRQRTVVLGKGSHGLFLRKRFNILFNFAGKCFTPPEVSMKNILFRPSSPSLGMNGLSFTDDPHIVLFSVEFSLCTFSPTSESTSPFWRRTKTMSTARQNVAKRALFLNHTFAILMNRKLHWDSTYS